MRHVLLLNADGEPLNMVTWVKAMKLIARGKVRVYEYYEGVTIRTVSQQYPLPSVIGLVKYVVIPGGRKVGLNRKNVLMRDNYRCQYCGRMLSVYAATMDHLLPLCRGGRNAWENIVAACRPCNHRKGNRTPEEAGMMPETQPWVPTRVVIIRQLAMQMGCSHWRPYLGIATG